MIPMRTDQAPSSEMGVLVKWGYFTDGDDTVFHEIPVDLTFFLHVPGGCPN